MNDTAREYAQYLRKRSRLGNLYRRNWLYPRLSRLIRGVTLDVGCGIGDMLVFRPDTVGADINEHNVAFCRQRGLDVQVMPIDELPFADAAFDTVLLDNVLEHIIDPLPLLKEVRRVLRREGHVVVGVPGVRGQAADSDHKVFYDEAALAGLAGRSGFRLIRFMYAPLWKSSFLSNVLPQYCVYTQWALDIDPKPGN